MMMRGRRCILEEANLATGAGESTLWGRSLTSVTKFFTSAQFGQESVSSSKYPEFIRIGENVGRVGVTLDPIE